jgi:hypothetical protein
MLSHNLSRKVATAIASMTMLSGAMTAITSLQAQAQNVPYTVRFYCGQDASGSPATFVERSNHSKPPVTIIRWTSNYFTDAGYRPWTRCQMVSNKFQAAYNRNPNFLFTYRYLNREPVICAADVRGGRCTSMLYTVKRGVQDPILTMLRLEKVRVGAAGALNESTGGTVAVAAESTTSVEANDVNVQDVIAHHMGEDFSPPVNTAATPADATASPINPNPSATESNATIW